MSRLLVKNGEVVSGSGVIRADVLAEDGVIRRVAPDIRVSGAEEVDARGMLVFPGFVDTHTHLDMDTGAAHTADRFESGTAAAVMGGTTTVLDFATQNRGETLGEAALNWHALADGQSSCDYGFHMAITDWDAEVAEEISHMGDFGITSYKLYMAYDHLRVTDAQVYEVLKAVKKQGGIVGMHCENGDLVNELIKEQLSAGHTGPEAHPLSRPDTVEEEAVHRFLAIAAIADAPVNIVHLSTKKGLRAVLDARRNGQKAYIETCPQYLLLDESNYSRPDFEGAKYVMSPPLRRREDLDALWKAVVTGEVDTVGTDHCSFCFRGQKELGRGDFSKIPNGAPGVDLRPQLMYTYGVRAGRIAVWDLCRLLAENPAKLFGMYPKKGALLEGSDADIVVWDPEWTGTVTDETQRSAADYTPYDGFEITGRPAYVFVRGRLAAQEGEMKQYDLGRFVKRGPCRFWR